MKPILALIAATLVLSSCEKPVSMGDKCAGGMDPKLASSWRIGPEFDKGGTRSVNMPRQPQQFADGIGFNFPVGWGNGHVHYVTHGTGPITGKSQIVMKYRIEGGEEGFVNDTGGPGTISIYFQRKGDTWTQRTEHYRWYANFATKPLSTGEHEIVAPLDGPWIAMMRSTRENNPEFFEQGLAGVNCIGFVLGGGSGLGHGVAAKSPAKMIVTDYRVE